MTEEQVPVIDTAKKAITNGIPVRCLLANICAPSLAVYVEIDSRKADRTAGLVIAKVRQPGEVAILVGTHRYLAQEIAEIGFRSYFREHYPEYILLESTKAWMTMVLAITPLLNYYSDTLI